MQKSKAFIYINTYLFLPFKQAPKKKENNKKTKAKNYMKKSFKMPLRNNKNITS